jgi:hypothetical protein
MIERLCLGMTLPLLLGAVQDDLPTGWKVHESKEGRFKVALPGTPMQKKQQVKTATGSLDVMMLIGQGRGDTAFVVSYCDYPEADLKKGTVEKRLDHARDGAVSSARGKLRSGSEKSIDIDGHPGRDFVIEKDGEIVARMQVFLVQTRLYQVMILGGSTVSASKEGTQFLESFRLIP